MKNNLVSIEWLKAHLQDSNLVVLDASLSDVKKDYIPRSRYFDIEGKLSDLSSGLPHTMPTPEAFSKEVRKLGVNQDSAIITYDMTGIYSAPRCWWMFKVMGFENVAVLDGGYPAWRDAGYPCTNSRDETFPPGNFSGKLQPNAICNSDQVATALQDKNFIIFDARSEDRFYGREPEPRPGLRPGHIPNSQNLSFKNVLNGFKMRSKEELVQIFSRADKSQNLVFSCGSGITACIILLAADLAGFKNLCLYDGSWSEWGLPSKRPVEIV